MKISTKQVNVQRFSVTTSKPFKEVLAGLEAVVSRPHMERFFGAVASAKTYADLEEIIDKVLGSSGFMEFIRFDLGEIVRKECGKEAPKSLRLLIGNPLIMKQMITQAPDVGSYAPVTVLIDERADGVHLSYDKMASLLAPYDSAAAMKVAQALDSKIEALLTGAAT